MSEVTDENELYMVSLKLYVRNFIPYSMSTIELSPSQIVIASKKVLKRESPCKMAVYFKESN